MKRKGLAFILGAIGVLSIGAISFSNKPLKVSAATDVGEMRFTGIGSGASTSSAVYITTSSTNVIGKNWTGPFKPVTGQGGVYINDESTISTDFQLKKASTYDYYFESLNGAISTGTTLTLFGLWSGFENGTSGTEYSFTILDSTVLKTSSGWKIQTYVPELDVYNKVTLKDAGINDYDRQPVDIYQPESAWNSFAVSPENTKKSFAFEFVYQAYETMNSHLEFRVGARGNYYSPHCYHFIVNNSWGPNGQYDFREEYNEQAKFDSGWKDFPTSIKSGLHTIEFGSIYLLNSNDTFDYVKCDGEYIFSSINTPYSHDRTTKVSLYIGEAKIFVGSSMPQNERDTTLTFNRTYQNKGIYLNGPVNNIPVDNDWRVRAAPANKYNALLNNEPLYEYGEEKAPLVKFSEGASDNYYISFVDYDYIEFKEGDVVTLSDEYHFFWEDVVYVLSLNPISFLYSNSIFTPINNIYDYMNNVLSNNCDPELYSDEDVTRINNIVAEAQTTLLLKTNMKELWDLYLNYLEELDSIPLDEEKAQEILGPARAEAIEELQNYYDPEIYDEEHLDIIADYLDVAITAINTSKSIGEINQIVVNTKTQIDSVPTKQTVIEEAIMDSDTLLNQYLETFDVVTTSDLCTTGDMVFNADSSYSSGDLKDVTTRFSTSPNNLDGNLIFQFNYRSTNPNSRKYDAQIYIRVRGTDDNCARFDIGSTFSSRSGVRLVVNNALIEDYDANLQANTTYKMECGSIDLDGFNRSLIFIRINGEFAIKHIVDQVAITQTPTVRIMDSYTTGSDTVTLSPVEDGTTKVDHAKIIGNLDLDPESTSNSLIVDMRKNDISNGTLLYPMEDGAFTVNDQQVPCYRPEVSLTKMNATQYAVNFDYSTLRNGSVVKLTGVFCSHDPARGLKKAYRLFEASFVYQNGTWSQTEPSLSDAIRDAKEMLNSYTDEVNYSESSWLSIQNIINTYVTQLDNASTVDNVKTLLNTALNLIDAVPTLLQDYQAEAKALLQAYSELHEYREDEQIELETILMEAFSDIANAEDYDEIDQIVNAAKEDIDSLKTAEERDLEDLEAEKRVAKTEVEVYTGLLEMNRYSQENINLIRTLAFTARDDIDSASSIEEIESIVSTFKEAIKNVKTNDGSVFNGETYVEPGSDSNNGCGGNIMTTSILLSILSLFGLLIILGKKHYLMFSNK